MNDEIHELQSNKQKLGVLIDETVDTATLNWIQTISPETMVRDAAVELNGKDVDIRNLANRVCTGDVDIMIFLTAGGFSHFFQRSIRTIDRERLVNSLNDIRLVAVGSLVFNAMLESDVQPALKLLHEVGWRDLLVNLDVDSPVSNLSVVVETTVDLHGIEAGLEARGAQVTRLEPIRFQQPDPSSEEQDILDAIEDGGLSTLLLPNSMCAARFASILGLRDRPVLLRNANQLVILALGEETEQTLTDRGIGCDIVLSRSQLESEINQSLRVIRMGKERSAQQLSGPSTSSLDESAPWYDSMFMRAIRKEPVEYTPIWMMRQAGRYMQEYREVREKTSFLELCKNPQLCSEVMCTAVNRLGVDAAIIFSDLLPILEPMGCDLEFVAGDGPVIHNPIRTNADIDQIKELESTESVQFVMDTVKQTRLDLPADMPLIGFAGAPFTLASYMIEGGGTKSYSQTKMLMFGDPGAWHELMSKLVRSITIYLRDQISAGAQCVQLFDSWAGCLGVHEYRKMVLPYVNQILDQITPLAPVINFATGNPALLSELAMTSAQVIGIDWRVPMDQAWKTVGHDRAVQGNLDPTVLLTSPAQIRTHAAKILKQVDGKAGHIFNLGHGILPQTPVDNAIALVEIVHELSQR